MKIANFSKQERRGLIGIFVLLLLIIIVIICQKYSSSESEEMLDSADKSFYEEILIYQEAVEVEFDSEAYKESEGEEDNQLQTAVDEVMKQLGTDSSEKE